MHKKWLPRFLRKCGILFSDRKGYVARRNGSRISANFRPAVEQLEDRTLPATLTWTGAVSTDWFDGNNWQTGVIPQGDDVLIARSNNTAYIVGGQANVATLRMLAGASLTVGSSLSVTGNLDIDAGAGTLLIQPRVGIVDVGGTLRNNSNLVLGGNIDGDVINAKSMSVISADAGIFGNLTNVGGTVTVGPVGSKLSVGGDYIGGGGAKLDFFLVVDRQGRPTNSKMEVGGNAHFGDLIFVDVPPNAPALRFEVDLVSYRSVSGGVRLTAPASIGNVDVFLFAHREALSLTDQRPITQGPVRAIEGIEATIQLAQFAPRREVAHFSASVVWGDSTSSLLTSNDLVVVSVDGVVTISALHKYTNEGSYTVYAEIFDGFSPPSDPNARNAAPLVLGQTFVNVADNSRSSAVPVDRPVDARQFLFDFPARIPIGAFLFRISDRSVFFNGIVRSSFSFLPVSRGIVMAESTQHKLDRVRRPRVQITYDVETGGAMQKCELPFVVGVLADLSGKPKEALKPIKERKVVAIDRDNFNDVLAKATPRVTFKVPNRITDPNTQLPVELNFKHIDDFEPAKVAEQIGPLRELLEMRNKLTALMSKMEGNDKLEALLGEVLTNTEKAAELAKAMGLTTEAPKQEGKE